MAVAVGGGPSIRYSDHNDTNPARHFICDPEEKTAAAILISLGALGIGANVALMGVIFCSKPLRRCVGRKRLESGYVGADKYQPEAKL